MPNPTPVRTLTAGKLSTQVFATRAEMGAAAAAAVAERMQLLLAEHDRIHMLFAAAPSQQEFLAGLIATPGIPWERVVAMHLDDYVGLPADAPQGFGNWLQRHLFCHVKFGEVHLINTQTSDLAAECARYTALLKQYPPQIACLGIGENGHIAFVDPWVADFADPGMIKPVELDAKCRQQQVNDGCFTALDQVPTHALTLTIPAMFGAEYIFTMVPAKTKAEAVKATLTGPVSPDCPASILREHANARLFLDLDSGSLI